MNSGNGVRNEFSSALRLSSRHVPASTFLSSDVSPAPPTRMLSNVEICDGWLNGPHAQVAQRILSKNPEMSLLDLQIAMLRKTERGELYCPYIWWVDARCRWGRALHEDSAGRKFVKLNSKWHLAYSMDQIGGLVGAQNSGGYEDIPKVGYFVVWENERIARNHSLF